MRLTALAVSLTLTFVSAQALAHQKGDLIIRGGIANVDPDASSSALVLDGTAIGRSEADVEDNFQLGLTFTYMLSDNLGLQVLASTPFKHEITADTGDLGLGTIDAGETKHLPPTVSLHYFPMRPDSRWQPYFGAGINYTTFFQEDVDSELEGVLGRGDLTLDDSIGLSLQAGLDYRINENLMINFDLWYVDIDTDAEFEFANNRIRTDVDIDPFVYMVSIGWRF